MASAAALGACSGDDGAGSDGPDRGDSGQATRDVPAPEDTADTAEDTGVVDVPDASDDGGETSGDTALVDTTDGSGSGADTGPVTPDITEVIVVSGAEALPDLFAAGLPGPGGPAVVYPESGTAMPHNVFAPLFQWEGPSGSAYRLRLTAPGLGIDVFTTDWSWQPDPGQWESIVRRSSGATIVLQVAQLGASGPLEGAASTLDISSAVVDGAMYYWAPTQSAIVRLATDATRPEVFVSGSAFACAGCHALSPDGSRLAYTRGGGTPIGPMGVVSTDSARTQVQPEVLNGYYPSFAGDNVHMAVARGGSIAVINTDTGDDVSTIAPPSGYAASQPAWSPTRDVIVFPAGSSSGGFDALAALGVSNAGLARVVRDRTGVWSAAEWLVAQGDAGGPGENLFYPAFSPDGNWVVFNRALSSAGAGSSPPGSELWLVNGNPAVEASPVYLERAQGAPGTTNSWPKWAPTMADGRMWIAFTSNRPYGRVPTGESQIWIASVRPNLALGGIDPSSAAYWMPHQELGTSNHVAYWAPYRKDDEAGR